MWSHKWSTTLKWAPNINLAFTEERVEVYLITIVLIDDVVGCFSLLVVSL